MTIGGGRATCGGGPRALRREVVVFVHTMTAAESDTGKYPIIEPTEFDLIVAGTGLPEALLAGWVCPVRVRAYTRARLTAL